MKDYVEPEHLVIKQAYRIIREVCKAIQSDDCDLPIASYDIEDCRDSLKRMIARK